jgi:anti-anti-sigma factor
MKANTILLERPARAISSSLDTITVGARLDSGCAKQFARALTRLADKRTPFIIIDMTHTKAVDSSGFGALIAGFRKLAEYSAAAVVVCSNPTVRRLFDFAGVARMITIVDRLKQARQLCLDHSQRAWAS